MFREEDFNMYIERDGKMFRLTDEELDRATHIRKLRECREDVNLYLEQNSLNGIELTDVMIKAMQAAHEEADYSDTVILIKAFRRNLKEEGIDLDRLAGQHLNKYEHEAISINEYLAGQADMWAKDPLNGKQKALVAEYVIGTFQNDDNILADALDLLEEKKVEFEFSIEAESDISDAEADEVRAAAANDISNSGSDRGYAELDDETVNWTLDITKGYDEITPGRLQDSTLSAIADMVESGNDNGELYDIDDDYEISEEAGRCRSFFDFVKEAAGDRLGYELPQDAAEFVYSNITQQIENNRDNVVRDAVLELENHPELAAERPKIRNRGR